MKFGFTVPNNFGVDDPAEVVALAVEAEQLGFDSVWVNHHVLNVGYVWDRLGERPYHDALVTLTWMAAHTSRVRLGTSVLVMPYLHPMVLAKELATLDRLSGGRLVVGLGVGSLPEENELLGAEYDDRGRLSNEFVEVLDLLWTQPSASYDGHYYSFEGAVSSPKPLQQPRPPILIGGNRPPALRRVGRLGDGWHPMMLSPESVAKRLPVIREAAEAAGRSGIPAEVSVRRTASDVTPELAASYAAVGVTELVVSWNTGDVAQISEGLAAFAAEHGIGG
ncbi:LLM class F420-dependent oxidoreductase [Candidatus Poriferisodalis sp.]|uniref:LLM class F420-dependent oxidoreductase n=1 Tax=Candidatus Poriferisodalis sp. TaxID=3101277 RepID=UPI003B0220AF